jgi:hypothetical protein
MMSGEGELSSELRRKDLPVPDRHVLIRAAGFIYRSPDDTPADEALARWATEVVPAVREAIIR